MQFETQRLILRDWYPREDARNAMDIYGDARVTDWLESDDRDTSIREVQRRLQGYADQSKRAKDGTRSWAVVQKDIGRVIGAIALAALPDLEEVRPDHVPEPIEEGLTTDYIEICWHFRPSSWGFGYATEAAFCIAQYGFETLELPLLLAVSQLNNRRAIAVMERLGMQRDGFTTRCYGGEVLLLYLLRETGLYTAKDRWLKEFVA